ncbi:MAG: helix-turn-helix transcriptional regulator [Deferrisomatales bacterium]
MLVASASFAAYVVWLLAFPMDGFLQGPGAGEWGLFYFLAPHVASLLACAAPVPRRWCEPASRAAGCLLVLLTLAYPHAGGAQGPLLFAAGLLAGPVAVRAGLLLKAAPRPRTAGVLGVAAGNLALALLLAVPPAPPLGYTLIGIGLTLPALARPALDNRKPPGPELLRFLPFVLLFHVVCGLSYGTLAPVYEQLQIVPGGELAFYVAAASTALWILRGAKDPALVAAVMFGTLSLALFQYGTPGAVNLSMYAMQAAAGFMDAFVLFLILAEDDATSAFGLGLGTVCAGILTGKVVSLLAGDVHQLVVAAGNGVLVLALLSLYFLGPRLRPAAQAFQPATEPAPPPFAMPPGLRARLSEMERSVVGAVLEGKTFKEAAERLSVSESSVKTYMRRVYEKAEVRGKAALLEKLARHRPPAENPEPGPSPDPTAGRPGTVAPTRR